ncbi:MAG: hypothetical protein HQ580_08420 [Planctomycetes bacterium]|nr:hypothetical protein [Planctomycetota bacterium]
MAKPSFRMFDYRLRPAKSTERKMLSEAFRRLSFFKSVENYRYVGFGSTTFTDFILFHRTLNIKDMISIENRQDYEARFEFNKPFDCIQMMYGDSNKVLPELLWNIKTITWLDYDGRLVGPVLQDVAYISMNAISGSVLLVTVNAGSYKLPDPKAPEEENEQYRLQEFKKDVGSDKVPGNIEGKHLEGEEMPKTCRRLIMNEIEQALRDRNGLCSPDHEMKYQPLFNFVYRDRAKMLTVGGIFYEVGDEDIFQQCQFKNLDYVRFDNEPYTISVPVMTLRERRYLDKRLPQGACKEALEIGLTESEIANYVRLYRYCPAFAEVELV